MKRILVLVLLTCAMCAYCVAEGALDAPTGVRVNVSPFRVRLSWDGVANALEYDIYRRDADGDFALVDTLIETSLKDIDVELSGAYEYYVVARAGDAASPASEIVAAQMRPPAPSGFELTSDGEIQLTWHEVERATGYRIYRSVAQTGFVKIAETAENNYVDEDLVSGAMCEYYVVACIGKNGSLQSEVLSIAH